MPAVKLLLHTRWEATKIPDASGKLPLHVACTVGAKGEIVQALVDSYRKATVTADVSEGMFPLHHACAGRMAIAGIKLIYYAFQEAAIRPDRSGKVSLHHICSSLNEQRGEVIKFLIQENSIAASIADHNGKLPLHVACSNGCSEGEVRALLRAYPEAASSSDEDLKLPLHCACETGQSDEVITLLLASSPNAASFSDNQGRLPLYLACDRGVSEDVLKLLLAANKEASSKYENNGKLPLHVACERGLSSGVISLLLDAYPDGAMIADSEGRLPLHWAGIGSVTEDVINLLVEANPENKLDKNKDLPLHIFARVSPQPSLINCLLDKMTWNERICREGGKDGRILPIHIAAEFSTSLHTLEKIAMLHPDGTANSYRTPLVKNGKEVCAMDILEGRRSTISADQVDALNRMTDILFALNPGKLEFRKYRADSDRMFRLEKLIVQDAKNIGTLTETSRRVWIFFCTFSDPNNSKDHYSKRVQNILENLDQAAINRLVSLETPKDGKLYRSNSSPECKKVIALFALFVGRYMIKPGPPLHKSQTAVVVEAQDVSACTAHAEAIDFLRWHGYLSREKLEPLCDILGIKIPEHLVAIDDEEVPEDIWEQFNEFCFQNQLNDDGERSVVIKLFRHHSHYKREIKMHMDYEGRGIAIVPVIEAMSAHRTDARSDLFARDLMQFTWRLEASYFDLFKYKFARIMPAGDRNLDAIHRHENLSVVQIRDYMREIGRCLEQLHQSGVVHGDVKALNVVRLSNSMKLIDLDGACQMRMRGYGIKFLYVGSKYSSGVLPPEMFAKLSPYEEDMYKEYWSKEQENKALWRKLQPRACSNGDTYVVKTFRVGGDGQVRNIAGLPYKDELVEASPQIDIWSFGVLLFTLTHGTLFPVDRNDDLASPRLCKMLHEWNKEDIKDFVDSREDDPNTADLLRKLLQRHPRDRPKSMTEVLEHPYFHVDPSRADV